MSAHPSSIQLLNPDVLWRIFDINADIFDDDTALNTTLASSYVCHSWRNILLSSTLIWAHVMDLDHPLWNSVEGSHEIIRRTGTALIWVQSYSCVDLKAKLKIMKENWERIQKLKVTIHFDADQHATFCQPAARLESFSIVNAVSGYTTLINFLSSLFSGNVPMLHDFRLMGPRLAGVEIKWGQQLCSMELAAIMNVDQTLDVLSSTTNLTNLRLEYTVENMFEDTLLFVSLPKLAHLDLNISNTLSPRRSTAGAHAHPPILRGEIICTPNPTARIRQQPHLWTCHRSHICMRPALSGISSPRTTTCHNHTPPTLYSKPHVILINPFLHSVSTFHCKQSLRHSQNTH